MSAGSTPPVTLISFGYLHDDGAAPLADLTVDLRESFRDPHASPQLRELTGADSRVIAAVLATPGAQELVSALAAAVRDLLASTCEPVTVAVGCSGGRHRSVVVADSVARRLGQGGIDVAVEHRHIGKPVVRRPTGQQP